jgi:hypothetical protein
VFVCLKTIDQRQVAQFHDWYFELHDRFGLKPDCNDPGEVVTHDNLIEKLEFAERIAVRRCFRSYYAYEAIVWTDLLSDRKLAVTGDEVAVALYELRCWRLMRRWRLELLELARVSDMTVTHDMATTLLFERLVHYEKIQPNDIAIALRYDVDQGS